MRLLETLDATADPSTFPQPPTKPKIVDRRATSVTISWRRNLHAGSSPLIGYTIEYFSSELETGWVVAAHRVTSGMIYKEKSV